MEAQMVVANASLVLVCGIFAVLLCVLIRVDKLRETVNEIKKIIEK